MAMRSVLWTLLVVGVEVLGEDDGMLEMISNSRNESLDEGEDLEEEWVREAVLDLAYYIRAHKFNEYDRRYKTNKTGERAYFAKFPDPPLRTIHWEVAKYCSMGLFDCLRYTFEFTAQTRINRAVDTVYVVRDKKWTFPDNLEEIRAVDEECRAFRDEDDRLAAPFPGPLTRFQWRTSVSYYMCSFTLQKLAPLSAFGEPCDNYAYCLWSEQATRNQDPRADDSKPFACAKYSFCPDPCCPVRHIDSIDRCDNLRENPCPADSNNHSCEVIGSENNDLLGLMLNHWNLSCSCEEDGFIWDSRFGMCVDVDECEKHIDGCNNLTETCINTRGSFGCICSTGYTWLEETQTCQPVQKFLDDIENLDFSVRGNPSSNFSSNVKEAQQRSFGTKLMAPITIMLILFFNFYL